VPSPKYNEICSIINKLESNKAADLDNIPPDLIKIGRTLKQKLFKFIFKIWDKEQLPTQWSDGIKYQAYKKEEEC
jgi:hypothetical protein